jgi:CTP synthase
MLEEGLDTVVLKKLQLPDNTTPNLDHWNQFLQRHKNPKYEITIGLIGKYVELRDSYKSIFESFIHAGAENEVKVNVVSIHSEFINENTIKNKISDLDGILVAPGFGERGIEGKIDAVQYAREHKIPFFGICLGMQMAVIEIARNVLQLKNANSTEMDPTTKHPVIDIMEEQKSITHMGGTMRLGSWACKLTKGSLAQEVYKSDIIKERHRHRYEFNNKYKEELEKVGLKSTGINPETGLVEIVELKDHPWFVGVQYHPEYKSTVAKPHPLFISFIKAAVTYSKQKNNVKLTQKQ